ncbi:hypothetical protein ACR3H8_19895 [Pseudomonas aeruginosa]|uniref:hypothetical protein n=1 Tax=Pseudomonas aeruginosa TaxID=287 RepID=UPI0003BAF539|nr:hypothetical protein [Pseudomonas aeruginosa]EIU2716145.1 hypothetical protein [Pseudomonas aeruginosa]EIU2862964.1 hypothetical protein [Pseudomonas aeruginosa]ERW61393.1 hypothetical protein Q024_06440 [Pseudomonas aeruginosa BWHPSA011]ETV55862.1 hypothetical protein Q042_05271 [Pseudomonas aeruginosa BWHPSA037]MBA5210111.1 hypothetical protein [Pseudomonas aeruginosa]
MHKQLVAHAGLMIMTLIASANAGAVQRQYIQSVSEIKPGHCIYKNAVFTQGEMKKALKDTTMVCTMVDGRSIWIKIDEDDLALKTGA